MTQNDRYRLWCISRLTGTEAALAADTADRVRRIACLPEPALRAISMLERLGFSSEDSVRLITDRLDR